MKAIETALSLTQAYKLGIERFEKMLGNDFSKAVESMNNTSTHIIICGMGKIRTCWKKNIIYTCIYRNTKYFSSSN